MIEVMNHIKVQLNPTGRPEYSSSQDDECVTAMKSIRPGEIMCRVHIADQSEKAPAAKGIEAWKYYRYNHYQGYNHVPNIVAVAPMLQQLLLPVVITDSELGMGLAVDEEMIEYRSASSAVPPIA